MLAILRWESLSAVDLLKKGNLWQNLFFFADNVMLSDVLKMIPADVKANVLKTIVLKARNQKIWQLYLKKIL